MNCSHCSARNSPAALVCHQCGAEFEAASTGGEVRPRRRFGSWLLTSVAVFLLFVAMDRLGLMAGRMVQNNPNSIAVASDESGLMQRYEAWKAAHGQSTPTMLNLYAPNARIVQFPSSASPPQTLSALRSLCDMVRQNKSFDSVTDLAPPQVQSDGTRSIITAQHRYGHSGIGQVCDGDRRLIWENRDGQWLIIEDDFPHSYTPVL